MNPTGRTPDLVSIVVVNFRGADDTCACLAGLRTLDWPADRLQVIVVDNASGDGSAERIRAEFPEVEVIDAGENLGFAGGCNRGAQAAKGRWIGFINNDARPDPDWIGAAARVLERDSSIACVASKVLDWDGNNVDFVGAALTFYGHGIKPHVGQPDSPAFDQEGDVLFATGAAMVVDAAIFRSTGGFDDRYFMFFEDVDFGWRMWLLGYRVRFVPSSLVYHRHHATIEQFGEWREHYLLERNALFTIYKNYSDESLARVLAPAVMLTIRRGVARGGDDAHVLDLQRGVPDDEAPTLVVDKRSAASTYAVDGFVEALPSLGRTRAALQASRQRSDQEIFRLFGSPLLANIAEPAFVESFSTAVEQFDVPALFGPRRKVVVATGDALKTAMAGPAIRAWQMAEALAVEHDVVLATTGPCEVSSPDFRVIPADEAEFRRLERWCDVFVFQGALMRENPVLYKSSKVMVVDIYDPFHLEQLEQSRDFEDRERQEIVRQATITLNEQLYRGDYFMCASDRQRTFWLGQLAAVGRINPRTYDDGDGGLEELLAVVPFGVDERTPEHTRPVLKGVVPGIGSDDLVILWGGGIYNWFDPLTLVRAVDKLRGRLPQVRLYFLGMAHPNPDVPTMRMAVETEALAKSLGLTGTHVFFNHGWVDYSDRQNYFLEADVGVSTHFAHIESEFSFRTRILDYFWASLPVVATGGDPLADILESSGAGLTVPAEDVDALEDALYRVLTDESVRAEARAACDRLAVEFRWSRVLEPLLEFCRNPRRAPDVKGRSVPSTHVDIGRSRSWARTQERLRAAGGYARNGDYALLARRAVALLRERLRR